MSPTTKRICRIAVTLRPDKVYTITLDHCIENLVPQRLTGYLIPLVRYYWGFDKGTKLEYEEFGGFTEEIIQGLRFGLLHISLRMLAIMPRIPWFSKFERQSNPLPFIACTHPQPL